MHSANLAVKQTTPKEKFLLFFVTGCGTDPIIILDPAEGRKRLERAESLVKMLSVLSYCIEQ